MTTGDIDRISRRPRQRGEQPADAAAPSSGKSHLHPMGRAAHPDAIECPPVVGAGHAARSAAVGDSESVGSGETNAPLDAERLVEIRADVVDALRSCYDPEIPVNIFDLGLIYRVDVASDGAVAIQMTLTSPACPVAGELPLQVERCVAGVEGVPRCRVELVWEPAWNPDLMTEAAKLELGFF